MPPTDYLSSNDVSDIGEFDETDELDIDNLWAGSVIPLHAAESISKTIAISPSPPAEVISEVEIDLEVHLTPPKKQIIASTETHHSIKEMVSSSSDAKIGASDTIEVNVDPLDNVEFWDKLFPKHETTERPVSVGNVDVTLARQQQRFLKKSIDYVSILSSLTQ